MLGQVGRSVNDVMMDLQTLELEPGENASLEAQQQVLSEKLATITQKSEKLRLQRGRDRSQTGDIERRRVHPQLSPDDHRDLWYRVSLQKSGEH